MRTVQDRGKGSVRESVVFLTSFWVAIFEFICKDLRVNACVLLRQAFAWNIYQVRGVACAVPNAVIEQPASGESSVRRQGRSLRTLPGTGSYEGLDSIF